MGVDVAGLLDRASEMAEACRLDEGNPGLELGLSLGEGWQDGPRQGLPARRRRLRALGRAADRRVDREAGQGPRARRPASPADGPDRQAQEVRLPDPLELGQEFFRWEFATAVAGVDPRHQPVRPAGRAGGEGPDERGARRRRRRARAGGLGRRAARRRGAAATTSASRPSSTRRPRTRRGSRALAGALGERTGCVVTHGFGPRYLHSTGQLHKGGPDTGRLPAGRRGLRRRAPIPGQPFGFARLIRAQAAGDFESLRERGRRVARVHLEEVA